ncbi:hypothetical protein dqs_0015 [Azoarcus olearius]|uniref:hypothetical protein n=1 Tax=Azoarcus sp. (strain BH72) TaxID=418699 RepID=UPI00080635EC|nr:hypothetical protein [Azoarcus olearius]ANQ83098.1 hypothetical protein dqs_0015 [Azoarcus olearius]
MRQLAKIVADESGVGLSEIMLLRHGTAKVERLEQHGATIEEYTLVQPAGSRYDFEADGMPKIAVVVVIVRDAVHSVYRILGVEAHGTTRTLTSPEFNAFDRSLKYRELSAKRFRAQRLDSSTVGLPVTGWGAPRHCTLRAGMSMFDSIQVP